MEVFSGPTESDEATLCTCCPLCREELEVSGPAGLIDVTCPACGLHFTVTMDAPPSEVDVESAVETSDDPFERWLAGEPIRQVNRNAWQRAGRWCRGRPLLSTTLGLTLAVMLLLGTAGVLGYWQASSQLEGVHEGRILAERELVQTKSLLTERTDLALWRLHQLRRETAARRDVEQRLLKSEAQRREAEHQRDHVAQRQAALEQEACRTLALQLAVDAESQLDRRPHQSLVLARESILTDLREGAPASPGARQILHDALARVTPRGLLGQQGPVRTVAISPDGNWLASGSEDHLVRLWHLSAEDVTGSARTLEGHQAAVVSAAFCQNGQRLITASHDGTAIVWDLTSDDPAAKPVVLEGHRGPILAAALGAEGRWLLTGGGDRVDHDYVARLWNLKQTDPAATVIRLRGHRGPILAVAVGPESHWGATAGKDKTIRLWNLAARHPASEQAVLHGHEGQIGALAFSPDRRWLISGSCDSTARLWDLRAADPAASSIILRGHEGWVADVAVSPDSRWLATAGFDKTVRLWKLSAKDPSAESVTLRGHLGRIQTVVFSPDGQWLLSGGLDKTVRLWDLTAQDVAETPIVLRGHTGPINALAVGPDGRWLVTGAGAVQATGGSAIRVWDLQIDALLETARTVAARGTFPRQRRALLLDAANRADALR